MDYDWTDVFERMSNPLPRDLDYQEVSEQVANGQAIESATWDYIVLRAAVGIDLDQMRVRLNRNLVREIGLDSKYIGDISIESFTEITDARLRKWLADGHRVFVVTAEHDGVPPTYGPGHEF